MREKFESFSGLPPPSRKIFKLQHWAMFPSIPSISYLCCTEKITPRPGCSISDKVSNSTDCVLVYLIASYSIYGDKVFVLTMCPKLKVFFKKSPVVSPANRREGCTLRWTSYHVPKSERVITGETTGREMWCVWVYVGDVRVCVCVCVRFL